MHLCGDDYIHDRQSLPVTLTSVILPTLGIQHPYPLESLTAESSAGKE
jgi:hypothetical protein